MADSNENGNPFSNFQSACEKSDIASALDGLANHLMSQQRFHELFEVRKLQLRNRLGLSVGHWQPIDELPKEQGAELETGLLQICREVGELLMKQGDVAAGWQYLEPVADRQHVADLLKDVQVTDENVEALIQVATAQGLAPELGFQLVLDRFGTCSSITTYESMLAGQAIEIRRGPARQLVNHLYEELAEKIRGCVAEHDDVAIDSLTNMGIGELMKGRDWLCEGLGHHIDTTHLASTVRIAKILDDEVALAQAIELAEYGMQLHEDFQYSGQAPFENTYKDTREFLLAIASNDLSVQSTAIERIHSAAQEDESHYLDCAAWYVYLLDRIGKGQQAVEAYLSLIHQQQADRVISEDVCPNLMTLLQRHGQHALAAEHLKKSGDLLAFATVVAAGATNASS